MRKLVSYLTFCFLLIVQNAIACDGLSSSVVSNQYIGNNQYLLTIEICEFVSNSDGFDEAAIYGILISVNGANVIGTNTPSLTGISSGLTINASQPSSNQVEYGDWGNGSAPVFLAYGDPEECWTIELIVDNAAVTVDVLSSSFDGASQPGFGMNNVNGVWGCGTGMAVPPASCNSDWTAPVLCEGDTNVIDLNATTSNTGVFSGTGVNSATNEFDPTGLSGNIPVTFTVGDAFFSCSTTWNIVLNPIISQIANYTLCEGENYTYPDGTVSSNIVTNESHVSNLVSLNTGCDSIITTNIAITPILYNTVDQVICLGDDYTYPDGTVSTNILVDESQVSVILATTGCDSVVTTNLTVASPIIADFTMSIEVGCIPQEVYFTNNSTLNGVTVCSWEFGDGSSSSICGDQTITYDQAGIYQVQLIIEDQCYSDTVQKIFVGDDCSIYIPNVVSLSSDTENKTWYVTADGIQSFECIILNRWGNVITTLNDVQEHWDARTDSGDLVNEGTYFYKIDLTYLNGITEQKHGFINVIH